MICRIFGDDWQATKGSQPHTRLLFEVPYRYDCDPFLPFSRPRLIILEQAFVHTGTQEVGKRSCSGVGFGDARDGSAFRNTDLSEFAGVADTAKEARIA